MHTSLKYAALSAVALTVAAFVSAAPLSVTVEPGEDLAAALARLRAERKPGARAELVLADGVHALTNTVRLGKDDSGLTIRAEHPGKAMVAGGWIFKGSDMKPVASSWMARTSPPCRPRSALCPRCSSPTGSSAT